MLARAASSSSIASSSCASLSKRGLPSTLFNTSNFTRCSPAHTLHTNSNNLSLYRKPTCSASRTNPIMASSPIAQLVRLVLLNPHFDLRVINCISMGSIHSQQSQHTLRGVVLKQATTPRTPLSTHLLFARAMQGGADMILLMEGLG